jgi:WD40 repeat protein
LPSNEASVVDCVDTKSYKKLKSLRPKTNAKDRGLLMNLKAIDANYLMAGYESGELALFDLRTYGQVGSISLFSGQPLMCFDYNASSNFGMCGSSESSLKHVAIERKENDSSVVDLISSSSVSLVNPGLNCIKIRKTDSKIFSCGSWDSRIRVYGVKKLKLLAVLDFHKEAINTIDFSNSNLMAAGSNDGIISFWNLY